MSRFESPEEYLKSLGFNDHVVQGMIKAFSSGSSKPSVDTLKQFGQAGLQSLSEAVIKEISNEPQA